jgi:hypothetical protein
VKREFRNKLTLDDDDEAIKPSNIFSSAITIETTIPESLTAASIAKDLWLDPRIGKRLKNKTNPKTIFC